MKDPEDSSMVDRSRCIDKMAQKLNIVSNVRMEDGQVDEDANELIVLGGISKKLAIISRELLMKFNRCSSSAIISEADTIDEVRSILLLRNQVVTSGESSLKSQKVENVSRLLLKLLLKILLQQNNDLIITSKDMFSTLMKRMAQLRADLRVKKTSRADSVKPTAKTIPLNLSNQA